MISEVLLLVLLACLVCYFWPETPAKGKLPPGPRCYPVIGSKLIWVTNDAREMRKKYGDVFRTKMGPLEMVFICNFKLIKEAFSKVEFTDRPRWPVLNFLTEGRESGVIFSNGQRWQNIRRFLLRNLRDLGMGKSYMDGAILEEAKMLVTDFSKHVGKPTPIPQSVNIAALNVIWRLVANKRYDLDDEELHRFIKILKSLQEDTMAFFLPTVFPAIKYLPDFIKRRLLKLDLLENVKNEALNLMKSVIDPHKEKLDPSNPQDVIDEYLIEMEKKSDIASFFSEEDLIRSVFDMFGAGFDTTSNMLRWFCLYMAAYPEVQQRVQEEIDSVVPRDTLPSHQDKPQLPYLEAVIHELQRKVSLIGLGVFHCLTEDTQLGGYHLKKDTVVMGVSALCHEDPTYWTDPDLFDPDRFLDDSGKFVSQKDGFLPFGIGRRQCLGEALARMELFLFPAALVQNFTFAPPPNQHVDLQPDNLPFNNFSKRQDILITVRK